jgi:hypothetical protein
MTEAYAEKALRCWGRRIEMLRIRGVANLRPLRAVVDRSYSRGAILCSSCCARVLS